MGKIIKIGLIASLILLSGCTNEGDEGNIRVLIKEKKVNAYSIAERIQILDKYETFIYNSFDKKDPFEKYMNKKIIRKRKNAIKPNFERVKEYLENLEMSELTLTGIIKNPLKNHIAVMNDGFQNHIVEVGNYLGKNYGKITEIKNNSIYIDEIYKEDGANLWIKKEIVIELNKYQ